MTLALFDLDNTLLSGDSDYEWGRFLVNQNLVDEAVYDTANNRFYEQYKHGVLDIFEFCAFSFKPLSERSMEELDKLHQQFMQMVITPLMGIKAKNLVEKHRQQGHTLMVITATNSFITKPIVDTFGIDNILATEPKVVDGRYTTEIDGIPCFQHGKVERLDAWLKENAQSLEGSYFYSDSNNDLPLLEKVDHPIAVDPDETLEKTAKERGWDIISLR